MQRLVLIDGNAILHRAYHALPPLTNRSGELVNAVYGFSTMLLKVISDLDPQFLIVVFDTPKPTFRKMEYFGYQAKRPQMDDELAGQIEKVKEVVKSFGIPIYTKAGYEADDVIGTLARQAVQSKKVKKQEGVDEVIIVTGDRDLMQLVGPKVRVYAPVRGMSEAEMFDEKRVEEKLGVKPGQIVDYKGLTGDQSDNYPGVPGVGPKTTSELLKKYQTLENLYQHLDQLPENLGKKLEEGKELALLSQKLARIINDVSVKLDLENCQFDLSTEEKEKVIEKFKEFGFKSLVARIRLGEQSGTPHDSDQDEKTKKTVKSESFSDDSQQKLF